MNRLYEIGMLIRRRLATMACRVRCSCGRAGFHPVWAGVWGGAFVIVFVILMLAAVMSHPNGRAIDSLQAATQADLRPLPLDEPQRLPSQIGDQSPLRGRQGIGPHSGGAVSPYAAHAADGSSSIERAPARAQLSAPPSALDRLKASYGASCQRCMERLDADPAYASAKAEADRLEAEVRSLRQNDPQRRLPQVSLQWIQAKSIVATMTTAAMKADADVQSTEMALQVMGVIRAPQSHSRSSNNPDSTVPASDEPRGNHFSAPVVGIAEP